MSRSSRTLVLASSYAFNTPTPDGCSLHSLLATLRLLSEAVSLENKEDKRTVLLPARLSFQDYGRKKLGHMKGREGEGPSFLYSALPESQESHTCQAFFVCLRTRGCFPAIPVASPFFSKVTVEAGRQSIWHQFPIHFWQESLRTHTTLIHFLLRRHPSIVD